MRSPLALFLEKRGRHIEKLAGLARRGPDCVVVLGHQSRAVHKKGQAVAADSRHQQLVAVVDAKLALRTAVCNKPWPCFARPQADSISEWGNDLLVYHPKAEFRYLICAMPASFGVGSGLH